MIDSIKIKKILTRMPELLLEGGYDDWSNALESCVKEISNEPKTTASKIGSMYGGMGSLNDVALYKSGKVLQDENTELDKLRKELHRLCQAP